VLRVYEDFVGPDNFRSVDAQHILDKAYAKETKYDLAVSSYLKALEIVESHFGKDHINGAEIMKDLAVAYLATGDRETARDLLSRAKTVFTNTFGEDHISIRETREIIIGAEDESKGSGICALNPSNSG
jgi:tetratricopeptide (TPR) repeat protein